MIPPISLGVVKESPYRCDVGMMHAVENGCLTLHDPPRGGVAKNILLENTVLTAKLDMKSACQTVCV